MSLWPPFLLCYEGQPSPLCLSATPKRHYLLAHRKQLDQQSEGGLLEALRDLVKVRRGHDGHALWQAQTSFKFTNGVPGSSL